MNCNYLLQNVVPVVLYADGVWWRPDLRVIIYIIYTYILAYIYIYSVFLLIDVGGVYAVVIVCGASV
jgi:hypothetical protein